MSSNWQTAAAAIVVCIASRVLNKMSMRTTVCVGWRQSGEGGYSYNRGPHIFLNRVPTRRKSGTEKASICQHSATIPDNVICFTALLVNVAGLSVSCWRYVWITLLSDHFNPGLTNIPQKCIEYLFTARYKLLSCSRETTANLFTSYHNQFHKFSTSLGFNGSHRF